MISKEKEEDFLGSLLSDMKPAAPETRPNPRKRKSEADYGRDYINDFSSFRDPDHYSSDPADDFNPTFANSAPGSSDDERGGFTPRGTKRFKTMNGNGIHVSSLKPLGKQELEDTFEDFGDVGLADFNDFDMDMDMEVEDKKIKLEEVPTSIPKVALPPSLARPSLPVKKEEDNGPPAWLAVHAALKVNADDSIGGGSTAKLSSSKVHAIEEDGTLRMFWLDYLENDGKILFIGKVLDQTSRQYVSACIAVENIERNLFVLPRPRRKEGKHETDIVPTEIDVWKDVEEVRKGMNIKSWKTKWVTRKYAFGEKDVPTRETQWLKVVYPFSRTS